MTIRRTYSLSALTLVGALALSACGGDDTHDMDMDMDMDGNMGAGSTQATEPVEEADGQFTDADVQFATNMIPHHQQAVMMSEIAMDQGGPEVAALAERIQAAQGPEIDTMTQWLEDWGAEAPMDMDDMDAESHDMGTMGDMGMEGMMSAEDMQALMAADGDQFDTLWLEMMIEHHEGAIAMAQTQQEEGTNPDAVDLAATMEEAQAAEILEMEGLLQQ